MRNSIIEVQNIKDYICISNFGKFKKGISESVDVIRNWLRNRITLEFLGTWESIYNPNFNFVEFDGFRKSGGLFLKRIFQRIIKTKKREKPKGGFI